LLFNWSGKRIELLCHIIPKLDAIFHRFFSGLFGFHAHLFIVIAKNLDQSSARGKTRTLQTFDMTLEIIQEATDLHTATELTKTQQEGIRDDGFTLIN